MSITEVLFTNLKEMVKFIEGLDALAQADHYVQHQIPVLVAEVDCHLPVVASLILLAWLSVEEVELDLHLLQFCGAVFSQFCLVLAVLLAKLHYCFCLL